MSVVRINAITVPPDRAEEFERRFAARAGEVSKAPGGNATNAPSVVIRRLPA